jgi:hypothetical protein
MEKIMKSIYIPAVIVFFLLISCKEDVINSDTPIKKGQIIGHIVDEISSAPLSQTKIKIDAHDISVISDSNGYFLIRDIPFGNYNINFSTVGYINEILNISLNDSFYNFDQVKLKRKIFEYEVVEYLKLPIYEETDSIFYELQLFAFQDSNWLKHCKSSNKWDSVFVDNFICDYLIKMKRLSIELDTVWYQSYENQCSHPTEAYPPKLVVRMKIVDNKIPSLNFTKAGSNNWRYCNQKPMHYRQYYKFN